jgi:hypothetical protein
LINLKSFIYYSYIKLFWKLIAWNTTIISTLGNIIINIYKNKQVRMTESTKQLVHAFWSACVLAFLVNKTIQGYFEHPEYQMSYLFRLLFQNQISCEIVSLYQDVNIDRCTLTSSRLCNKKRSCNFLSDTTAQLNTGMHF